MTCDYVGAVKIMSCKQCPSAGMPTSKATSKALATLAHAPCSYAALVCNITISCCNPSEGINATDAH